MSDRMLDAVRHHVPTLRRADLLAARQEASLGPRVRRALDLDRDDAAVHALEHEIDLGAGTRPVVARPPIAARVREDLLDREALPRSTEDRVVQERHHVGDPDEPVQQPRVAHVHLGRLRQTLRAVARPRLELTQQEEIGQHVDVAPHGGSRQRQVGGQACRVQHVALPVREHRPRAAHELRRQTRTDLGQIALEVGSEELSAPLRARRVVAHEVAAREPAAQPGIARCRWHRRARARGRSRAFPTPARARGRGSSCRPAGAPGSPRRGSPRGPGAGRRGRGGGSSLQFGNRISDLHG